MIVPSLLALIPLPGVADITPAGSRRGGHVLAHEPVHMIFPPASDARSYRVNPVASTRAVPTPGTDLVPIVTEPPSAVGPLLPPELRVLLFAHADNTTRVAADTIQTSRALPLDVFAIRSSLRHRAPWKPDEGTTQILSASWEYGRTSLQDRADLNPGLMETPNLGKGGDFARVKTERERLRRLAEVAGSASEPHRSGLRKSMSGS
jgi:hypothetical protein